MFEQLLTKNKCNSEKYTHMMHLKCVDFYNVSIFTECSENKKG